MSASVPAYGLMLVMFPVLVYMYAQLAKRKEREALAFFPRRSGPLLAGREPPPLTRTGGE